MVQLIYLNLTIFVYFSYSVDLSVSFYSFMVNFCFAILFNTLSLSQEYKYGDSTNHSNNDLWDNCANHCSTARNLNRNFSIIVVIWIFLFQADSFKEILFASKYEISPWILDHLSYLQLIIMKIYLWYYLDFSKMKPTLKYRDAKWNNKRMIIFSLIKPLSENMSKILPDSLDCCAASNARKISKMTEVKMIHKLVLFCFWKKKISLSLRQG